MAAKVQEGVTGPSYDPIVRWRVIIMTQIQNFRSTLRKQTKYLFIEETKTT